jgi:hypothetical protein
LKQIENKFSSSETKELYQESNSEGKKELTSRIIAYPAPPETRILFGSTEKRTSRNKE